MTDEPKAEKIKKRESKLPVEVNEDEFIALKEVSKMTRLSEAVELYHEGGYISKFDVREAIISTMNELKNDPHPDKKVNKDLEQQNLGIIKFQRLLFQKLDLG